MSFLGFGKKKPFDLASPRGQNSPRAGQSSPRVGQPTTGSNEWASSEWQCPQCTLFNSGTAWCAACATARPRVEAPQPSPVPMTNSQDSFHLSDPPRKSPINARIPGESHTSTPGAKSRFSFPRVRERSLSGDEDNVQNHDPHPRSPRSSAGGSSKLNFSLRIGRRGTLKGDISIAEELALREGHCSRVGEPGSIHCWYAWGHYRGGGVPYMSLVQELNSRPTALLQAKKADKLLSIMRELCVFSDDSLTFDSKIFSTLSKLLDKLVEKDSMLSLSKEHDSERKIARYIHYFLVTLASGNGVSQRNLVDVYIVEALTQLESECQHANLSRRASGLRACAALCYLSERQNRFMQTIEIPLKAISEMHLPQGKLNRKAKKEHMEQVFQARFALSALRRCPVLLERQFTTPQVLMSGAITPDRIGARHAFALLAAKAQINPAEVAAALQPHLQPTIVGVEPISVKYSDTVTKPNLADELACVYYLLTYQELIFGNSVIDDTTKLDFYTIIYISIKDERPRVALQAIQCMFKAPTAWDYLLYAMLKSKNDSMFIDVISRLTQLLQRAQLCEDWALAHSTCRACFSIGQAMNRCADDLLNSCRGRRQGEEEILRFMESNKEQTKALMRTLRSTFMLESPNLYVTACGIKAMFLLVADPEDQSDASWRWLSELLLDASHSLNAELVEDIMNSLFFRISTNPRGRSHVIHFYFQIFETLISTQPRFVMVKCLAESWLSCLEYELPASTHVLGSIFRILDVLFTPDFFTNTKLIMEEDTIIVEDDDVPTLKQKLKISKSKKPDSEQLDSVMDAEAVSCGQEGTPEEMRESALWLRRMAFHLLGLQAVTLSGQNVQTLGAPSPLGIGNAYQSFSQSAVSDVTGSMLSILTRLKEGTLFEDDQTRYVCTESLVNIALDCGSPLYDDISQFLNSIFPIGKNWTDQSASKDQLEALQFAHSAFETSLHSHVLPLLVKLKTRKPAMEPTIRNNANPFSVPAYELGLQGF